MLSYGKVIGRFVTTTIDTAEDADNLPNTTPLSGTITFVSSAKGILTNIDGEPTTVVPYPIVASLNADGYIQTEGDLGVSLISTNSADVSPLGFTYRVFFNLAVEGRPVSYEPFDIAVPTGSITDLTVAVPVQHSNGTFITQGRDGSYARAITTVGSNLVFTMSDGVVHTVAFPFISGDGTVVGGSGKEVVNAVREGETNWVLTFSDGTKSNPLPLLPGPAGVAGERGPQGLPGAKGDQGNPGPQGLQGIQGQKGDRGEQGIQGLPGIKGDTGAQGIQGIQGLTGQRGLQGLQGIQGERGIQGEKGEQGTGISISGSVPTATDLNTVPSPVAGDAYIADDTGLLHIYSGTAWGTGVQFRGPEGLQGIQGVKGDTGEQGLPGERGLQGIQGERGLQGLKGDKGDKGDIGQTGLQGIQGVKGDKGDQGIQGLKGDTGASAYQVWLDQGNQGSYEDYYSNLHGEDGYSIQILGTVPTTADIASIENVVIGGAYIVEETGMAHFFNFNTYAYDTVVPWKGDHGIQGIQGVKGDTGLKGDQGIQGIQGIQGQQGIKGDKGDKGDQGLQGVQGVAGEQGQDGTAVSILGSVTTATALPTGASDNDAYLANDTGHLHVYDTANGWIDVGNIRGPQGIQGIQGIQGVKGDKGDAGSQGIQGVPGLKGDTGEQGQQGIQGIQGVKGDTGATGLKGDKGDTGDQGLQGIQGLKGDTGLKGDKGDTGLQGPSNVITVQPTVTGNAGSNASVSIAGTSPNQSLTFTIPRGANGTNGTNGTNGVRGSLWYVEGQGGVTSTASVTGALAGDNYLNPTTGDVQRYSGTAWASAGNIKGPKGDTGTNGTNGTNGAGIATGGTTNQVLAKNSATNYDTKWVDLPVVKTEVYLTQAQYDALATKDANTKYYITG